MDNLKLKDTYGKIEEVRILLEEIRDDMPPYTYASNAVFEALKSTSMMMVFLSQQPFDPLDIGKLGDTGLRSVQADAVKEPENENPDVVLECGQHESAPEEDVHGEDNESVDDEDDTLFGKCPKCGDIVCSVSRFCPGCGQRLFWRVEKKDDAEGSC